MDTFVWNPINSEYKNTESFQLTFTLTFFSVSGIYLSVDASKSVPLPKHSTDECFYESKRSKLD